jgi:ribonuclease HII
MLDYEDKFYSSKIKFIVGTDEAGRGPLAGPVVAAAVILPEGYHNEKINDSKKLSEKTRLTLFQEIKDSALAYCVCAIDAETIDRINIYEASRLAMTEAIRHLHHEYNLIITDAMKLPSITSCQVIDFIKGDAQVQCVAAASILAKVCRDQIMYELDHKFPQYQFKSNKGYPTHSHYVALSKYGPIPHIHRFTYGPVKNCNKIKLF